MRVLVIVPAYNEELNIDKVVADIKRHTNYDYVIVDDCSRDGTLKLCKDRGYNVVHLPVNYGLASGVQIGFKYAMQGDYDVAIQFDGDGQHQACYLSTLVNEIKDNDIVIGSRFVTEKKPLTSRMIGSRVLTFFIKMVTGKKINDPTSGMRAFNRSVIKEYALNMNYPPEPDTLVYMLKKGKKIKEVQVEMSDREFGESYLNPIRSIKYMCEMIISVVFIQLFRKR